MELSILRQSRGIQKVKARDVSKLSRRRRMRGPVGSKANTDWDGVTKLRSGRSLSVQNLDKLEVVDSFDHENVSKARRRYSRLSLNSYQNSFLVEATQLPRRWAMEEVTEAIRLNQRLLMASVNRSLLHS